MLSRITSVGFLASFPRLSPLVTELIEEKVAYKRLYMDTLNTLQDKVDTTHKVTDSHADSGLYLDHLAFSYAPKLGMVFDGISYTFPHGRISAIIDESGKGKSTLIKLIMGLYTPSSGAVWYREGKKQYQRDAMYDQVSYVPSGYSLFSGSIRENIAYGNSTASESE